MDSLGDAGPCTASFTNEITVVTPTYSTTASTGIADLGPVTILNPVINPGVSSMTPSDDIACFYCKPKPTGMLMPVSANVVQHDIMTYPNPVLQRSFNLVIDAAYSDRAIISLVDLSGNTLHVWGEKEIVQGKNHFLLTIPHSAKSYSNYLIRVKFNFYSTAVKLFLLN
jgi:hypothetical protein